MEAGRELNALVAEHVMGLEKLGCHDGNCFYHIEMGGKGFKGLAKSYSTAISPAWEVVEKLRESKMALSVMHVFEFADQKWAYIAKVETYNKADFISDIRETAPHAICLAALKAVGYELSK